MNFFSPIQKMKIFFTDSKMGEFPPSYDFPPSYEDLRNLAGRVNEFIIEQLLIDECQKNVSREEWFQLLTIILSENPSLEEIQEIYNIVGWGPGVMVFRLDEKSVTDFYDSLIDVAKNNHRWDILHSIYHQLLKYPRGETLAMALKGCYHLSMSLLLNLMNIRPEETIDIFFHYLKQHRTIKFDFPSDLPTRKRYFMELSYEISDSSILHVIGIIFQNLYP